MSSLTLIERQRLERELGMASGYVLDFSNRTFAEFFSEIVGVSIFDPCYEYGSGSKANRMRAFWKLASDEQAVKLFEGLLEGWSLYANGPIPSSADQLLKEVIGRLGGREKEKKSHSVQENPEIPLEENLSSKLHSRLIDLSSLPPQRRGFEFEKFLKHLFDAYGLSAHSAFRLTGEQIDGSFVLNNEIYLLEAKWQNSPTGAADLHTFEGKLSQKAVWSRGLFLSNSSFSSDGLEAFGRGKRIICMDGLDLSEMLRRRFTISRVLEAKIRRAAETGKPFTPLRELFP